MSASRMAAHVVATWFGSGLFPIGPGTAGSVAAIPLHMLLRRVPVPVHVACIAVTTAVGIWAGQRRAADLAEDDPPSVVIDEVVGVLLALGLVRDRGSLTKLLAFVLFRALDIAKPGPIDGAQHLEPAGVGIMADDVLAGIAAGLSARLVSGR
jgi:phosphatidylglycerophosphatase A